LHNGHTASESDGNPQDWIDPGEFWDHHYGNFPSGFDPREKLTTLWYHDHRLDFTASNVYAGLAGFYLLFEEQDSGNENDPNPAAWRLPSGKYDVPLLLHDVLFDQTGQVVFNPFVTHGWLGDMVTVNRKIRPRLEVERRKYRIRILNGGPSRFYQLFLSSGKPFTIVTGDGNFQPEPVKAESIYLSVAQRVDIIIDFTAYKVGDSIVLINRLLRTSGKGPTGILLDPGDGILRFDVVPSTGPDNSRVPDFFPPLPTINLDEVKWDGLHQCERKQRCDESKEIDCESECRTKRNHQHSTQCRAANHSDTATESLKRSHCRHLVCFHHARDQCFQ